MFKINNGIIRRRQEEEWEEYMFFWVKYSFIIIYLCLKTQNKKIQMKLAENENEAFSHIKIKEE